MCVWFGLVWLCNTLGRGGVGVALCLYINCFLQRAHPLRTPLAMYSDHLLRFASITWPHPKEPVSKHCRYLVSRASVGVWCLHACVHACMHVCGACCMHACMHARPYRVRFSSRVTFSTHHPCPPFPISLHGLPQDRCRLESGTFSPRSTRRGRPRRRPPPATAPQPRWAGLASHPNPRGRFQ